MGDWTFNVAEEEKIVLKSEKNWTKWDESQIPLS